MPADELTPAQSQYLLSFAAYLRDHGRPPTLREMCERLGFSSTNSASTHAAALVRKGYLTSEPSIARGQGLTAKGRMHDEERQLA